MTCPVTIITARIFCSSSQRQSISGIAYGIQLALAVGIIINIWRAKVKESIGCIKESVTTIVIMIAVIAGGPILRAIVPEVQILFECCIH